MIFSKNVLVSSLEDADYLLFGCFSRVGELADILHGVFCHDAEVFFLDTKLAQILRDANLFGNLTDGSNGFSCSVHGGETVNVLARGLCDIAEAVCVADQVEFLYMGQPGSRCRRREAGCRSRLTGEPWHVHNQGKRC